VQVRQRAGGRRAQPVSGARSCLCARRQQDERGELSGDEIDTLLAAAASPEERCCCRPLISRRLCPLRSNCYRIKGLPRIGFLAREIHAGEFGDRIELPVPEPHGRVVSHSTVHRFGSESSVGITADAVPEPNRFSPVA